MIQGILFARKSVQRKFAKFLWLGGDPTGTGRGGASIYGRNFPDEIHEELKHTGKDWNNWKTVGIIL